MEAVLRNGSIVPVEPVPADWPEGTPLRVEKGDLPTPDIDAWAAKMNELCQESTPEDMARMNEAILAHRRQSREQVCREMGLDR